MTYMWSEPLSDSSATQESDVIAAAAGFTQTRSMIDSPRDPRKRRDRVGVLQDESHCLRPLEQHLAPEVCLGGRTTRERGR